MPVDAALAVDVGAFPAEELSSRVGTLLDNSKDVPLARTDINLYPLADRFTLDLPTQPTRVYSLGDFVLALGVVAAAAEVAIKLAYTRQTE